MAVYALCITDFINNIETVPAILFILGFMLLVAEIFMPGFGVSGGIGITLMIVGIIMTASGFLEAFILILILLVLAALFLFLILRSAKRGRLNKKLILHSAATGEEGFRSTEDASGFVGLEGVALTLLRPAGTGEFDGKRLDVVSEGEFIEPGSKIKVVSAEGRRIIVRSAK